jgi:hypothetical protein
MSFKTLSLLVFFTLSACTKNHPGDANPKQRLTDYVQVSFNVKDPADKTKLVSFLTGGAKNRLAAWSDEQFRQAFIDTKREFIKLAIREMKSVSNTETNITYELSYIDQGRGADARVTNKRMCELVLENGTWYIKEVHNIKELIEYKNELSVL